MARHRSPGGRRAHLGPPLPAVTAAAGVGGAHQASILSLPQLTPSLRNRVIATAIAGGTLAAVGQTALAQALPLATDGANVLRMGVEELVGVGPESAAAEQAVLVAAPLPAVAPVTPDPVVAGAADLVKAADLQRQAVESAKAAAEAAKAVEAAKTAEAARAAEARRSARGAPATPGAATPGAATAAAGGVRMITGRVSSGFGSRGGTMHFGLDIATPIGTPIHVPLAGTVVDSGPASGFGLWVRVRHADGTVTVYGHINRSLVRVGQKVAAGQVIAESGNRGQSTGPHLHIEVITPGGQKINPRPWLDARGIGYS